ncbi:MAG: MspA family porin [Mycobacteriaceae bacterium]
MTNISTMRRRGFKFARSIAVTGAVVTAVLASTGTASAALDSEYSIVDSSGNDVAVQLSDTSLYGVFPLDGNLLTHEWFHSGKAGFEITGPSADGFTGTIEIGYQVGYAMAVSGSLGFSYSSPSLSASGSIGITPEEVAGAVTVPFPTLSAGISGSVALLPTISTSLTVAPGPGIVEVVTAEGDISGASGYINIGNINGTVTGALGGVNLRPFVRLTTSAGIMMTYGKVVSV